MKLYLLLSLVSAASSLVLPGLGGTTARRRLKSDLLKIASETKRGLDESPQQRDEVRRLFESLERLNPTRKPLRSDLVNGSWSLEYTTSDSILGRGGFPRVGPIVQKIDASELRGENSETVSYFGLRVPRKVTAELDPQSDRLTNVKFKRFSVGPVGFDAPDSFRGYLDITYLDEDLRLTRGDKGNLFLLTRMDEE